MLTKDKNFYKSFVVLTVTLMLEQAVVLSVNLADNIMLGNYSETALSGVAAVNQIQFIAAADFFRKQQHNHSRKSVLGAEKYRAYQENHVGCAYVRHIHSGAAVFRGFLIPESIRGAFHE